MFKKVLTSIGFSVIAQVFNLITSLYVSRAYPDAIVAQYSVTLAIAATLLTLSELGTSQLVIARSRSGSSCDLIKIRAFGAVLASLISIFAWSSASQYYPLPSGSEYIFSAYIISSSVSSYQAYRLQGLGQLKAFLKYFYGRTALHFLILSLYLILYPGAEPASAFLYLGTLANLLSSLHFIRNKGSTNEHYHYGAEGYTSPQGLTDNIRTSLLYTLTSLCVAATMRADAFILPHFSLQWTAEYFKAKNIAISISILTTGITQVYLSDARHLFKNGLKIYLYSACKTSLPFLIMPGIFIITPNYILELFYNESSPEMGYTFCILVLAYATGFITNPLGALLIRTEHAGKLLQMNLTQFLIVYSLGFMLARFGHPYFASAIMMAHIFALGYMLNVTMKMEGKICEKINS